MRVLAAIDNDEKGRGGEGLNGKPTKYNYWCNNILGGVLHATLLLSGDTRK